MVNSVFVNPDYYCSDEKWCINPSCPLSKGKYRRDNPLRGKIKTEEIEERLERVGFGFDEYFMFDRIAFQKPLIKIEEDEE